MPGRLWAWQPNPWAARGITTRETDVLQLVAEGLASRQIAAQLRGSPQTVEKHVEKLLRKTGARSRNRRLAVRLSASIFACKPAARPADPAERDDITRSRGPHGQTRYSEDRR